VSVFNRRVKIESNLNGNNGSWTNTDDVNSKVSNQKKPVVFESKDKKREDKDNKNKNQSVRVMMANVCKLSLSGDSEKCTGSHYHKLPKFKSGKAPLTGAKRRIAETTPLCYKVSELVLCTLGKLCNQEYNNTAHWHDSDFFMSGSKEDTDGKETLSNDPESYLEDDVDGIWTTESDEIPGVNSLFTTDPDDLARLIKEAKSEFQKRSGIQEEISREQNDSASTEIVDSKIPDGQMELDDGDDNDDDSEQSYESEYSDIGISIGNVYRDVYVRSDETIEYEEYETKLWNDREDHDESVGTFINTLGRIEDNKSESTPTVNDEHVFSDSENSDSSSDDDDQSIISQLTEETIRTRSIRTNSFRSSVTTPTTSDTTKTPISISIPVTRTSLFVAPVETADVQIPLEVRDIYKINYKDLLPNEKLRRVTIGVNLKNMRTSDTFIQSICSFFEKFILDGQVPCVKLEKSDRMSVLKLKEKNLKRYNFIGRVLGFGEQGIKVSTQFDEGLSYTMTGVYNYSIEEDIYDQLYQKLLVDRGFQAFGAASGEVWNFALPVVLQHITTTYPEYITEDHRNTALFTAMKFINKRVEEFQIGHSSLPLSTTGRALNVTKSLIK
jgi:hypothetical protein